MPGQYPDNWKEIATAIKDEAGWCCIRCGHPHDPPAGYTLTVHHLEDNKDDCAWHNLVALCQRCHLHIQAKVKMNRIWMFEHSAWFKPYVAGYYARAFGLDLDRQACEQHADLLIRLGQGTAERADVVAATTA